MGGGYAYAKPLNRPDRVHWNLCLLLTYAVFPPQIFLLSSGPKKITHIHNVWLYLVCSYLECRVFVTQNSWSWPTASSKLCFSHKCAGNVMWWICLHQTLEPPWPSTVKPISVVTVRTVSPQIFLISSGPKKSPIYTMFNCIWCVVI